MARISEDGESFLKVATAAPDFENLPFDGIPDHHSGPTITIKSYVTSTVTAAAGSATYFLMTPQGGVAFWKTVVPTTTDWVNGQDLTPTMFPKSSQIFHSIDHDEAKVEFGGTNTEQVTRGRCVSTAAEMQCLNNAFNQYGSITAWKVPLSCTLIPRTTTVLGNDHIYSGETSIMGIYGVSREQVGSQAYSAAVKDGVYATAMNREGQYDFHPVIDGETQTTIHEAFWGSPTASPGTRARFNGPIAIWDNNFDTIVFRVDIPPGVGNDQSFLLKRWVTMEYEPVFNSLLYDTARMSPPADDKALALYSEMARHLPLAVGYKDNPDFWDTILQIVDETSSIASSLPGPIGVGAKGVHAVARALKKEPRKLRPRTKKARAKPKARRKKKTKGR